MTEYVLTTGDGTRYDIDQNMGLLSITDRNGNTLSFQRTENRMVTTFAVKTIVGLPPLHSHRLVAIENWMD